MILLVGDGMGDSEVTLARYYGKGAAGRLNMDRLRVPRQLDPLRAAPGPRAELPAQLRRRLRPDRDRVVDRQAHAGRPRLAGPVVRGQRARLQRRLPHVHGDRARPRQGDRQRLDRRDHRRDARRRRARTSPSAPARDRRTRARPARPRPRRPRRPGLGSIAEQQVDEGFDVYLGGGRNRYEQTLAAGGTDDVDRLRRGQGLHVRRHQAGARRRSTTLDGGAKVLGLFNPRQHDDGVRAAVRAHQGVLRRQPGPRRRRSRAAARRRAASRRPAATSRRCRR